MDKGHGYRTATVEYKDTMQRRQHPQISWKSAGLVKRFTQFVCETFHAVAAESPPLAVADRWLPYSTFRFLLIEQGLVLWNDGIMEYWVLVAMHQSNFPSFHHSAAFRTRVSSINNQQGFCRPPLIAPRSVRADHRVQSGHLRESTRHRTAFVRRRSQDAGSVPDPNGCDCDCHCRRHRRPGPV
jgi:hypothetical protein